MLKGKPKPAAVKRNPINITVRQKTLSKPCCGNKELKHKPKDKTDKANKQPSKEDKDDSVAKDQPDDNKVKDDKTPADTPDQNDKPDDKNRRKWNFRRLPKKTNEKDVEKKQDENKDSIPG
jgi:hypothetical protein